MDEQDARDTRTGAVRLDDPWYDSLASGWGEVDGGDPSTMAPASWPHSPQPPQSPQLARAIQPARTVDGGGAEVYLQVQRSMAFQEVRARYRRFVFPAAAAFLCWYLAYVVLATTAHGLMARQVVGPVNVAMLAGLAQFATTFLLTWAYVRHARLRRDRAALELRWDTQELTRRHSRPSQGAVH